MWRGSVWRVVLLRLVAAALALLATLCMRGCLVFNHAVCWLLPRLPDRVEFLLEYDGTGIVGGWLAVAGDGRSLRVVEQALIGG
ncbi:hypothetical protein ACTSKR_11065 [Chitinibacteraceae bacterium HSL-7]